MQRALSVLLALAVASCAAAAPTTNPSFPISQDDAYIALVETAKRGPKKLERPLVILGGFLDLGVGPALYAKRLERYVSGDVIRITFFDCTDFESCRRRVIETLDRELGEWNDRKTVEVDVIGQSMGGLVAMHAAMDDPKLGKRLHIRRLFTISSPLQGSERAARMPFDLISLVRDMRPGSKLYQRLAKAPVDYEIYSYTRLEDRTVGARFAAAIGRGVWWVDNPPMEYAHAGVFHDRRVLLDIVRRLRGEPPVTTMPPAPVPEDD